MKENSNNRPGRGGRREGAGRKPTPHGKIYCFQSSVNVDSVLSAMMKGKTAFINAAIEAYAKEQGLL